MPRLPTAPGARFSSLCAMRVAVMGFVGLGWAPAAQAWGDAGHQIVALVAEPYLQPTVRQKVAALLAADDSGLTPTDIAHEATWADKFRDSDRDGAQVRYLQTRQWHFVDIELSAPDLDAACFGHRRLPAGIAASAGPAQDCVVDKIDAFAAELRSPATPVTERRRALQFLLHFVGDLHQPLHASDDDDQGGNQKTVVAHGMRPGSLHHYWDTEFVAALGAVPQTVADTLVGHITPAQAAQWQRGSTRDWALESSGLAVSQVYGRLPHPQAGVYPLSRGYTANAESVVRLQLSRAGVRLAHLLNAALAGPAP